MIQAKSNAGYLRPELVHDWTKAKFSLDHKPTPMPAPQLAKLFWGWWSGLNAPARFCTTLDGRFTPGAEGAKIAIENLRMPGKHGWLGILYFLSVWRESIGSGDMQDWSSAVADVDWVTRRLIEESYYNATKDVIPTLKR